MFIQFYTKGKYLGSKKITNLNNEFLELRSWILSGNDIKLQGKLYNDIPRLYQDLKDLLK